MDLENIVISEVRESQGLYDIAYMWNLRSNRNESLYKTEPDSQTENKFLLIKGEREEGE